MNTPFLDEIIKLAATNMSVNPPAMSRVLGQNLQPKNPNTFTPSEGPAGPPWMGPVNTTKSSGPKLGIRPRPPEAVAAFGGQSSAPKPMMSQAPNKSMLSGVSAAAEAPAQAAGQPSWHERR